MRCCLENTIPPMTAVNPPTGWHQPVMVNEVLRLLDPQPSDFIVDATAGTGGHSLAIGSLLSAEGKLLIVDRDAQALEYAKDRLSSLAVPVSAAHDNYRNLPAILQERGFSQADGVVLDLGMSSFQVDDPQRGFSFLKEGPLDMRMNPTQELTAGMIVNRWDAASLADLLGNLGEERFARRIAQRIIRQRKLQPIETTLQLAETIRQAVPPGARYGRLHPATRTFQALRMAVNDELGALRGLLDSLGQILKPGGRAVVISFHSLEDRLVKQAFVGLSRNEAWQLLTKKPLCPAEGEISANPRARSAKLRAIRKING